MTVWDADMSADMARPGRVIRVVILALALFVAWAAIAWVDEIVRADGQIVSSSRPQIVQNFEGGILAELTVQEGDLVERGAVLARLQGTEFKTATEELADQIAALDIRRLRIEAELAGASEFDIPEPLAARLPQIAASERALLRARQTDLSSRLKGAKAVLTQAATEKKLLEDMLDKKIVALIEVTRARKAHSDAELRYNEIATRAELERATEYSETLAQLTSLRQSHTLAQDQLARTVITAPMRGIVNSLAVTTIGGVVRPGEEIFQIIPLGEEVFVEARVAPENIANVVPGQEATIKLTAYDYTIFGTLKGKVKFISADTFEDENTRSAEPYYRVSVSVDATDLTARQEGIELRPGMRAQVELHTGGKTILRYLMKPLYKSREAFREP